MTRLQRSRSLRLLPWFAVLLAPAGAAGDEAADTDAAQRATTPATVALPFVDRVETALHDASAAGALTGLMVVDAGTGDVLYARNENHLLNPASNTKLFTTAAALYFMGPSYRYPTEVYVDQRPRDGVVSGNLYVKGYGDPKLVNEEVFALCSTIASRGITEIAGDLIIDDTWFDAQRLGAGWEQETGDHAYLAPVGALSVNFNTVSVRVGPGSGPYERGFVALNEPNDYVILDNLTHTTAHGWPRLTVTSEPLRRNNRIVVRGRVPSRSAVMRFFRRIDNPPFYAGAVIRQILTNLGVTVRGATERGRVPDHAHLLETHYSPPLSAITNAVNKYSNNFMSEMMLKALGAHVHGPPGSWEKGVRAVGDFTEKALGIPREAYLMGNGSGLNDVNRFSAAQVTRLLVFMYNNFGLAPEYVASLGVAGRAGTVSGRMEETAADGALRAKTGTLQGVSALSGYVPAVDGRLLAFSMMMNGFTGSARRMWDVQDAIGVALAELDPSKAAVATKSTAGAEASTAATSEDAVVVP